MNTKRVILLIVCVFSFVVISNAQTPNFSFTASVEQGCPPLNVEFSSYGTGITSYYWNFGNGNTSTLANPVNMFTSTGSYSVMLIITSNNGNVDTVIKNNFIEVFDKPQSDFFVDNSILFCEDIDSVSFVNQSVAFQNSIWDFGDGNISTENSPKHLYQQPGEYTISLIVYNTDGCFQSSTKTKYIAVKASPQINFNTTGSKQCLPNENTSFNNTSLSANTYLWNFGDGGFSTDKNPAHSYASYGTYTVKLTAYSIDGCESELEKLEYITIEEPTFPSITVENNEGCSPLQVNLSSENDISDCSWKYENNQTQTIDTSHFYNNPGEYTITMFYEKNNCVYEAQLLDTITVFDFPSVEIFASDTIGCIPLKTKLWALSQDSIINWEWTSNSVVSSFSDSLQLISYQPGFVSITLAVENNLGCRDTIDLSSKIFVSGSLPKVLKSDSVGCAPLHINFSGTDADAVSWNWDFGNGNTSSNQTPSVVYEHGGIYSVFLKTINSIGCVDSISFDSVIVVTSPEHSQIVPDTIIACESHTVDFDGKYFGKEYWTWNFGDGTLSNVSTTTHTFDKEGVFAVSLATTSFNGCPFEIDTFAIYIIDKAVPKINWELDCNSKSVQFIDSTENAVAWSWNFGDQSLSSEKDPLHFYLQKTSYSVFFQVTTTWGCAKSLNLINIANFNNCIDTNTFILFEAEIDSLKMQSLLDSLALPFSVNNSDSTELGSSSICIPYSLMFFSPYSNAVSWYWEFGDGNTSVEPNPIHTYTTEGNFTLRVTCTRSDGTVKTLERTNFITIDPITADFDFTQELNCGNTVVQFNNTSSENASTWEYNFGDGTSSTLPSPNHIYTTSGNKSVQLNVTNGMLCKASRTKNIFSGVPIIYLDYPKDLCVGEMGEFSTNFPAFESYLWTFSDGTEIYSSNALHSFSEIGEFSVTLTVNDKSGCESSFVSPNPIHVHKPIANFAIEPDLIGCDSIRVEPNNTSLNASEFYWNFGDGFSYTGENPIHRYIDEGVFSITLTAKESHCQSVLVLDSAVHVIKTKPTFFTFIQENQCFPITINCVDSSISAVQWLWNFGDGTTSNLEDPTHSFSSKPSGKIKLTTTDQYGCKSSFTRNNVNPFKSSFSLVSQEGCVPRNVYLESNATTEATFDWYFSDGGYSDIQNPMHTFLDTGSFHITFVATSEEGCKDSIIKNNIVHIEELMPNFDFEFGTTYCAPALINFNDLSVNPIFWEWSFGDGSSSSLQHPSHIYNLPGCYNVKLIVGNSPTCIDSLVLENVFHILGPELNYRASDDEACDSLWVQFDNLSVNAIWYEWYLGDGNISNEEEPIHHYSDTGIFVTSLKAYDVYGCEGFLEGDEINIHQSPIAEFTADTSNGCGPLTVNFTNSTQFSTTSFWKFGDNTSASMQTNPSHVYTNEGVYLPFLIASNSFGCKDTAENLNIVVHPKPQISFLTDTNIHCPGSTFRFENLTLLDEPGIFNWYSNNEFISEEQSPSIQFDSTGFYSITLNATNRFGCTDSSTYTNYIRIEELTPPAKRNVNTVTVLSEKSVLIEWEPSLVSDFSHYVVFRKNTTNTYDTIAIEFNRNNTLFIDSGLNTTEESYCYIIQTVDNCGVYYPVSSHQNYCTIRLQPIAQYDAVLLLWTPYVGCTVTSYSIRRSDLENETSVEIALLPSTQLQFIDSIDCPEKYFYTIVANELCEKPYISSSAIMSQTSNGHSIEKQESHIIRSTVHEDSSVFTEWEKPAIRENQVTQYFLYRMVDNSEPGNIAVLNSETNSFLDEDVDVKNHTYQYYIETENTCDVKRKKGNQGESILLKTEVDGFDTKLEWTPYTKWKEGVSEYIIERMGPNGEWEVVKVVKGNTTSTNDNFKSLLFDK